ncbi:MAG: hypothetical protein NVSMB4_07470 [Acidimicrobiales bacterium]
MRFIDENRTEFGVEPICSVLQVAPSTYYCVKSRPVSARAASDARLKVVLLALWCANYEVYGARKLWKAAVRAGHGAGRDQIARLMRELGIRGLHRGTKVRTTRPDERAARHPDLVKRRFVATRPNALWVTDLTYVPTWSGMVYVCFIIDAFSRMIVGWRVASNMATEMVLDALEMARWSRGTRLEGLVCHSDAGSQGGINRSSQHLTHGGGRRWLVLGNRTQRGRCGANCPRRADRRDGGASMCRDSGRALLPGCPASKPRSCSACHPPLGAGGSVRLAGCVPSPSPHCPGVTCLSPSGKSSPS